jgi:hypothetical protein
MIEEDFNGDADSDVPAVDRRILSLFAMMEDAEGFARHFSTAADSDSGVVGRLQKAKATYVHTQGNPIAKSKAAGEFAGAVAREVFDAHPKARGSEWEWHLLEEIATDALSRRGGANGDVEHAARETYVWLVRVGLHRLGEPPEAADELIVDAKPYYLSGEYQGVWIRTRMASYTVEEGADGETTAVLVGVDGQPLRDDDEAGRLVITSVAGVTSEVLKALDENPRLFHELSPRGFEEVIAELLNRLGFDTTLTQQTRDGGADIVAYKSGPLGPLLYLVECKKNAPHRPVGIDVVRQLWGTVSEQGASVGVLATTSYFTKDAEKFRKKFEFRLQLHDFQQIIGWLKSSRGGG